MDIRTTEELTEVVNMTGQHKASRISSKLFLLGILGGVYISFGAIFYTVMSSYGGHPAFIKLIGGVAFSLGLILVVLAGAELFTGNNLMVFSYMNNKITLMKLLRNWTFIYLGNFIGSILLVVLLFYSEQYLSGNALVGKKALGIAQGKIELNFVSAFVRGLLCNVLVCLAIWLTMLSKSITGKVLGIIFPITGFIVMGFEHCIANMYLIPMGIFIKNFAPSGFWTITDLDFNSFSNLTIEAFLLNNLLPVTIGNIIGGVFFVSLVYWFIHKKNILEN